jgi:hypothetical protein
MCIHVNLVVEVLWVIDPPFGKKLQLMGGRCNRSHHFIDELKYLNGEKNLFYKAQRRQNY